MGNDEVLLNIHKISFIYYTKICTIDYAMNYAMYFDFQYSVRNIFPKRNFWINCINLPISENGIAQNYIPAGRSTYNPYN